MYYDFFNEFIKEVSRSWNRSIKEKDGYLVIKDKNDKGYIAIFNTIGISKDDLKVQHTYNPTNRSLYLKVFGNTNIKELDETITSNYEIILKNVLVKDVEYRVKDGYTYVYITIENSDMTLNGLTETKAIDDDVEW